MSRRVHRRDKRVRLNDAEPIGYICGVEVFPPDVVLGVWYAAGQGLDVMAVVVQKPEERFLCTCRVRIYIDAKVHDSDDLKTGMRAEFKTREEAIRETDALVKRSLVLDGMQQASIEYLPVDGGLKQVARALESCSWAHIKVVPK